MKGETFEFCHILDGVIELTEEGGKSVTYRKGDSFVMKPGYRGVWKTIETVQDLRHRRLSASGPVRTRHPIAVDLS